MTVPRTISTGIQASAPSGSSTMPTRIMPKAPSFINTPAWSMLTPVGAATWPSGDQVWKGHKPASTPKPIMNSGKTQFWKAGLNSPLSARMPSSTMEKVPLPTWAAATYKARMPIQMSTLPPTSTSISFIAPYSLGRLYEPRSKGMGIPHRRCRSGSNTVLLPHTPISRYMGSTASS